MCGICGFINFNGNAADANLLDRMTDKLVHRGPDSRGVLLHGNVALGHRRLSIIDLSDAGRQPMQNEDGTITVVFNGEIYNFQSLRTRLESKGHIFKSHTDTEVIVHLYEEMGENCLSELRGMFAFAIFDKRNKAVFIARDRVGKKPLVYTLFNNSFYFASEIKSILEAPGIKRDADHDALLRYMSFIYVPSPFTAFKNISKLPPGCSLMAKNGKVEIKRYWKLEKQEVGSGENEIKDTLFNIFEESVKLRMSSDVPLGALLSGGFDSSGVVALASRHSATPIKTFSIGTGMGPDPEFPYASLVSKAFKTDHTQITVKPDLLGILPKVIGYFDEPCANYPILLSYLLTREMKKYVTVVLTGDGADELFGGYSGYNQQKRFLALHKLLGAVPAGAYGLLAKLAGGNRGLARKLLIASTPAAELKVLGANLRGKEIQSRFFPGEGMDTELGRAYREILDNNYLPDGMNQSMFIDLMYNHQHNVVLTSDICGMANSLEIRCPYLDNKLVEAAFNIPAKLKVPHYWGHNKNKYIMKKAFENILPDSVRFRRKMGFGYAVPYQRWLRTDWKSYVEKQIINDRSFDELIGRDAAKKTWSDFIGGDDGRTMEVWSLLVLKIWHDMYILNKTVEEFEA